MTTLFTIGQAVRGTFLARHSVEVPMTGKVVGFGSGGVEVTFDAPIEYAPGMMRDGAYYRADQRWMVQAA